MSGVGGQNTRGGGKDRPLARVVAEFAERQHGVVSLKQLRALGLSDRTVESWEQRGWLQRLHVGVFAVGYRHAAGDADGSAARLRTGSCAQPSQRGRRVGTPTGGHRLPRHLGAAHPRGPLADPRTPAAVARSPRRDRARRFPGHHRHPHARRSRSDRAAREARRDVGGRPAPRGDRRSTRRRPLPWPQRRTNPSSPHRRNDRARAHPLRARGVLPQPNAAAEASPYPASTRWWKTRRSMPPGQPPN